MGYVPPQRAQNTRDRGHVWEGGVSRTCELPAAKPTEARSGSDGASSAQDGKETPTRGALDFHGGLVFMNLAVETKEMKPSDPASGPQQGALFLHDAAHTVTNTRLLNVTGAKDLESGSTQGLAARDLRERAIAGSGRVGARYWECWVPSMCVSQRAGHARLGTGTEMGRTVHPLASP